MERRPRTRIKLLIEGIGGIGGVLAGQLIRAGYRPTLVTGNEAIARAITDHGLRVRTPTERFTVAATAHASLEQVADRGPFDVALLIMKAAAVEEAARRTAPLLAPERGFVVPCQNGIVEDAVAAAVGPARVVSGIVGWGGTMHRPGVYERTGPGAIHLGELDGPASARVRRLARVLGAASPVICCDNMRGALWSKLGINCTITTGGALTGQPLGALLRDARARRAFLGLYREVIDTAHALGVRPEPIAMNPYLLYLPLGAGLPRRLLKDALMRLVGLRYRRLRSSSLQSLQRGRRTEIDFLNGHVVACARALGREAPLNEALVRLIKEIEGGRRAMAPDNLDELLRAR